jgi:uncharacterized LabA/DUF88 family protein
MSNSKSICRIGVFYDGSYYSIARRYLHRERELGWLQHQPFHALIEKYLSQVEQGFSTYRVVYAAWFQGMFASTQATGEQLKFDRNEYHDPMHAGIEPKFLPMSQGKAEKGIDVALAVDALQAGLDDKIDIAVLVTGDADFVPLVRALMKEGKRVLAIYFEYTGKDGGKGFINERLSNTVNYALDICSLESSKDFKADFRNLFKKIART